MIWGGDSWLPRVWTVYNAYQFKIDMSELIHAGVCPGKRWDEIPRFVRRNAAGPLRQQVMVELNRDVSHF
jgi:hypothetical protein